MFQTWKCQKDYKMVNWQQTFKVTTDKKISHEKTWTHMQADKYQITRGNFMQNGDSKLTVLTCSLVAPGGQDHLLFGLVWMQKLLSASLNFSQRFSAAIDVPFPAAAVYPAEFYNNAADTILIQAIQFLPVCAQVCAGSTCATLTAQWCVCVIGQAAGSHFSFWAGAWGLPYWPWSKQKTNLACAYVEEEGACAMLAPSASMEEEKVKHSQWNLDDRGAL